MDHAITYLFDANDRLLSEVDDSTGIADDRYTAYAYGLNATATYGGDWTQQTIKAVHEGLLASGAVLETNVYGYDLRGRMVTSTAGPVGSPTASTYGYDDVGNRLKQTTQVGAGPATTTLYVVDANNPTGFAQILEEKDGSSPTQATSPTRTYALGLDVISQADAGQAPRVLSYDGHGSTRQLVDPSTAVSVAQVYAYDAYSNMLAGAGLTSAANASTTLLYSGEQTDKSTGLQYLRARYYASGSGRFTTLDPFAGDVQSPQSLHKYLYVHGDPIQGVDPSGQFELGGLAGTLGSLAITGVLNGLRFGAIGAASGALYGAIDAGLANENILDGTLNGLKWGGAIGFGVGLLAPFVTTFLSGPAQSFLLNLGAGASLTVGAYGASDSFDNGHTSQGIFRLGIGFLGAYGLRYSATRPTKPVNIGGEGEIRGVINLQGKWALGEHYGRSQPTPVGGNAGRSLAGMILEGNDFQIYDAAAGTLPYANNSVPRIYTNVVPSDTPPGGYFPGVSSNEISRVLVPGGQWIDNGTVVFTK